MHITASKSGLTCTLLCCRFIRDEADDNEDTWEVRLAKRYYSKLFKEYCIADLSKYKVIGSALAQVLLLHVNQAMQLLSLRAIAFLNDHRSDDIRQVYLPSTSDLHYTRWVLL